MRNVYAPQNDNVELTNSTGIGQDLPNGANEPAADDRTALEQEMIEAMNPFSPGDRGVLKDWHRHSISLVHINVLTSLRIEGPLSMRRLAERLDISDASATGIVDRMEKRGLVERRHDTADRRVVLVCLTDRGTQVLNDMDVHRRQFMGQLLARLTDDDLQAVARGMRAVMAARRQMLAEMAEAQATQTTELSSTHQT